MVDWANVVFWAISTFIIIQLVYRYVLWPRGIKIRNPFRKKKTWGKRYGNGENLT